MSRWARCPTEDENGVPSDENRFQVKVGKTTLTWDGRLAERQHAGERAGGSGLGRAGTRDNVARGRISLSPALSRAMVGSLKVEGKDAFAKALRASPTRFAGPAYEGGGGTVRFATLRIRGRPPAHRGICRNLHVEDVHNRSI